MFKEDLCVCLFEIDCLIRRNASVLLKHGGHVKKHRTPGTKNNQLFLSLFSSIAGISLVVTGCAPVVVTDPSSEPEPTLTEEVWEPQASAKFSSPWPTQVTNEELTDTALFRTYEFFDENQKPDCSVGYNLHLGEPILAEHKPLIEGFIDSITDIYCDYLKEPLVVIGGNNNFVLETVAENSYRSDEFGGVCGYKVEDDSGAACAFFGTAWIGKSWGPSPQPNGQKAALAAHEVFHLVHDGLDPDSASQTFPPGHPTFRPVWFIEGAGEFFGSSVASYLDFNPYGTGSPRSADGKALEVSYLSDLEYLEVRRDRAWGNENYFSGKRALEYMVASQGVEAVLDIWVNLGKGMNFYKSFKKAMGISLNDFYDKFEEMHSQLYSSELVTGNY